MEYFVLGQGQVVMATQCFYMRARKSSLVSRLQKNIRINIRRNIIKELEYLNIVDKLFCMKPATWCLKTLCRIWWPALSKIYLCDLVFNEMNKVVFAFGLFQLQFSSPIRTKGFSTQWKGSIRQIDAGAAWDMKRGTRHAVAVYRLPVLQLFHKTITLKFVPFSCTKTALCFLPQIGRILSPMPSSRISRLIRG